MADSFGEQLRPEREEAAAPPSPATPAHRRGVKSLASLTAASAERLRQRCLDQASRRRSALVEQKRADVEAMCARIVRAEFDAADDDELDVDLMLWLEQQVLEHISQSERKLFEEQQAYEDEALAALLETHLTVTLDENDQNEDNCEQALSIAPGTRGRAPSAQPQAASS